MLATFIAYKSIYLWIGIFLAFETRKVDIEALNDAKFVAAAVYMCIAMCIPLVPIVIALQENVNIAYGIVSGGILLATTTVLCVLFVPRVSVYVCVGQTRMIQILISTKSIL